MYFEQEQILQFLVCSNCSLIDEPRLLPCGNTICNDCVAILNSSNPDSNAFTCSMCCDEHVIPAKGFPINKSLLGIIELKPKEVYRGKIVDEFQTNLEYIDRKKAEMDFYLNFGEELIKKHCENLRKQVLDAATSAMLKIKQFALLMTVEILKYEKECLVYTATCDLNFVNVLKKKCFQETINQLDEFDEEWTGYLNKFNYDEDAVIKANELALELKKKAREERIKIKNFTYNNKFIEFESNPNEIATNIIGSLKHSKIDESCTFLNDYLIKKNSVEDLVSDLNK